jgi:carbonic anhydrase/acetyltransferase-like protein (isoleucine patch superfamily)
MAPSNVILGHNVSLEYGVILKCHPPGSDGMIRLGNNVRIQEYALIHSLMGLVDIGDDSYIGPHTVVYGHARNGIGGTKIGRDVLIALHCKIIPANHVIDDVSRPIRSQGFVP